MSSAILYLGIVAIWAFVLIPRWLRKPHLLGGESSEDEEHGGRSTDAGQVTDYESAEGERPNPADLVSGWPARSRPRRARVLRTRRRLLTTLVTLTGVAAACTYLKLTSWWACVPPAGVLGMYLLLLREAAVADAERARWRATEYQQVRVVRQHAHVEHSAEVIDISDRLGDQLYDQYADAAIRAVGD